MESTTEEEDGKDTDEEDERTASHLIDGHRGVQKADVHELEGKGVSKTYDMCSAEGSKRTRDGSEEWRRKMERKRESGSNRNSREKRTVVPVRSQRAGSQRSRTR